MPITPRQTIVLTVRPAGWYVDFKHTMLAPLYRDAWGTTVVPLPFAATVPDAAVVSHVARLNPDCVIQLAK